MNTIKKTIYLAVFFLILTIHFFGSARSIDKVYQECDSDGVYLVIENFPQSVISYSSWSYNESSKSQKFKNLRLHYLEMVSTLDLARPIRTALALAWGSTYSPGVGIIYGVITRDKVSFESFLDSVLIVTVVLTHVSAILMYLIFRNLKYRDIVCYSLPLLFVFSSSIYSYQFHMGSTIWNVCTGIIFLYFYVRYEIIDIPQKKKDLYLSISSGLLLFFNYLIVIYWLTYFVIQLIRALPSEHKLDRLIELFVSNVPFFTSLILILAFFFQPDQGTRGSFFDGNYLDNLYYIILNFTSLYNGSQVLDFIQFIMAAGLILGGFFIAIFNSFNKNSSMRGIGFFALIFVSIVGIFVSFNMLSLAPSRHILFLLPIVYLLVATSLNLINIRNTYFIYVAPIVIALLFISMSYRNDQLYFDSQPLSSLKDLDSYTAVIVRDCSTNILHSQTLRGMKILSSGSKIKLESGKYLYLSQVNDFSLTDFVKSIEVENLRANFYYSPIIKIEGNRRFLPYSPFSYAHNRPNNFYAYKIDIVF